MKSIWSTDLPRTIDHEYNQHILHYHAGTIQIRNCSAFLIRKFRTNYSCTLWLWRHSAFTYKLAFSFWTPLTALQNSLFCICHNRSEISANITTICNDIGWVILQVKQSKANVSVLHHRATLTLIENLENYWTVKQGASSLWEISRGQLNRPSLIWNSQIKVEFRSSIWRALENWQQLKWIFWLV